MARISDWYTPDRVYLLQDDYDDPIVSDYLTLTFSNIIFDYDYDGFDFSKVEFDPIIDEKTNVVVLSDADIDEELGIRLESYLESHSIPYGTYTAEFEMELEYCIYQSKFKSDTYRYEVAIDSLRVYVIEINSATA